jgi:hypothetical protein
MITNFEDITHELTEDEKKLIPVLIKGFKNHKKENPIRAQKIVAAINSSQEKFKIIPNYVFSEVRLRRLCNFIRSKGILPLMATSKGYYVSYDKAEIESQIKSLTERGEAIINSAKGLHRFL